jgi:hypothetical protein
MAIAATTRALRVMIIIGSSSKHCSRRDPAGPVNRDVVVARFAICAANRANPKSF